MINNFRFKVDAIAEAVYLTTQYIIIHNVYAYGASKMVTYYGFSKKDFLSTLHDALTLLEKYSPGPECQSKINDFKRKDPVTGDTILDLLAREEDQVKFAKLTADSGIKDFLDTVGDTVQCHAHLDTDNKGRAVYKILSVLGWAPGWLTPNIPMPLHMESATWACAAYAKKASKKNSLSLAWKKKYFKYNEEIQDAFQYLESTKGLTDHQKEITRKYVSSSDAKKTRYPFMELYILCSALQIICGFNPDARALKGKNPMKEYMVRTTVEKPRREHENYLSEAAQITEIRQFVESFCASTEVGRFSYGISIAGGVRPVESFEQLSKASENMDLLDSPVTLAVDFAATDAAAQKIADRFPLVQFIRRDTGKILQPRKKDPAQKSPGYGP